MITRVEVDPKFKTPVEATITFEGIAVTTILAPGAVHDFVVRPGRTLSFTQVLPPTATLAGV